MLMSVDCSLLLKSSEGIREIQLDRYIVFSSLSIGICEFVEASILKEALNSLPFKDGYNSYWIGYVMGCIEQIYNENEIKVGIFTENHLILTALFYERKKRELKYDYKGFLVLD